MKLENLVQRNAQIFPNKPWMTFEGKVITFKDFMEQTNAVANGLLDHDVKKGDRVAILLENCDELINLFFSVAKIGAICVPMNYLLSKSEQLHILNNCQPKVFIFHPNYIQIAEMAGNIKSIQAYFMVSKQKDPRFQSFEKLHSYSKNEPKIGDELTYNSYEDIDPAFIQYTGGTTGLPKGVVLSHKSLLENVMMTALTLKQHSSPDELGLLVLPIFHAAAILGLFLTFMGGTSIIVHNGFNLKEILKTIEQKRVTGIGVVPTMLSMMVNDPEVKKYDLSSITKIAYGGAPISSTLLKKTLELFPNAAFSQVFGQTEAGPALTALTPEDHEKIVKENREELLLSAGQPNIGITVKIIDPLSGIELPDGEVGEIVANTPTGMITYWNDPEKTSSTIINGWLHTGDVGYLKNGYLFVVDRKKDIIISGGENIYSNEVEDALLRHDAVEECAVIGIPHEKWGEAVHAVVVLSKGYKKSPELEQELIAFCKDLIARYKAPKSIDFKRGLPKTASGKVLKRKLREKYWKGLDRSI